MVRGQAREWSEGRRENGQRAGERMVRGQEVHNPRDVHCFDLMLGCGKHPQNHHRK